MCVLAAAAKQDQWVDVDESFAEQLVAGGDDDDNSSTTGSVNSDLSSLMKGSSASASAFGNGNYKYELHCCINSKSTF